MYQKKKIKKIKGENDYADPQYLQQIINSQIKRTEELEKENEFLKKFINFILPNFNPQNMNNNIIRSHTFKPNNNGNNAFNTMNFVLSTGSRYSISVQRSTKLSDVFSELKKTCLQSCNNFDKVNFLYQGNIITDKFKGLDTVNSLNLQNNQIPILIMYD